MNRPRAADDFANIRAGMAELRREREGANTSESGSQLDPWVRRGRAERGPPERSAPGRAGSETAVPGKQPDRDRAWWARRE